MTTRQEFEVWAESEGYLLNKLDDNSRSYEFESSRYAWYGWQGATKKASHILKDERNSANELAKTLVEKVIHIKESEAKLAKEQADKARLVEALKSLIDDLSLRAKIGQEDAQGVVACGNGVWVKVNSILAEMEAS